MKKTIIAAAAVAMLFAANVFAKEKSIACVQKITIVCPCDIEFLKKTFNEKKEGDYLNIFYDHLKYSSSIYETYGGKNGEFILADTLYDTEKKDFLLPQFRYYFLNKTALVVLPPFAKYSRENDMKYVYTGSWVLTLDPYTFELTDIKLEDEFDQAKEWLAKKKSKKVAEKLLRAELLPLDEK